MSNGYALTVSRDVIARHYLIGGDWGAENQLHSHHYRVDLVLSGSELDEHGYLVDIVAVDEIVDRFVGSVRDSILNDLPAFSGLNPSIEHFARIAWEAIVPSLPPSSVKIVTVRIHENEIASVAYTAPVARSR